MITIKFNNKTFYIRDEWHWWNENYLTKEITAFPNEHSDDVGFTGIHLYNSKYHQKWIVGFAGAYIEFILYLKNLYFQFYHPAPEFDQIEFGKIHIDQFLKRSIKLKYFT